MLPVIEKPKRGIKIRESEVPTEETEIQSQVAMILQKMGFKVVSSQKGIITDCPKKVMKKLTADDQVAHARIIPNAGDFRKFMEIFNPDCRVEVPEGEKSIRWFGSIDDLLGLLRYEFTF